MKKKVIIAHPSKQHSFYTATAVKKEGYLFRYITTVYDREGSLTYKLKSFLGKKDMKKASTHKCEFLEDNEIIQYYEIDYLISLALNRVPRLSNLREIHRQYVANKFGRKVAKYAIKNNVNAVIMYDTTATACFKYLKKNAPQIKRILDVSIVSKPFMKNTFEKNMKLTGDNSLFKEHIYMWNNKHMQNFVDEIIDSNYFIVPSNIVKESLIYCGAEDKNIKIVPYGVDINQFTFKNKKSINKRLKLIYVGQVTYRKGIHHLLEVISKLNADEVEVELVGTYSTDSNIYKKYSSYENIKFTGFVTRDNLSTKYQQADVFVFPTLGEGYGLVVLEAMSCGLPVICSDYAGGNDAVVDGENGFVFPAGNEHELQNKIEWFIKNRQILSQMSKKANESVQNLTWFNYYDSIGNTIREILED